MSRVRQRSLTITRREVPFVDREEELFLLDSLAQEMAEGKGQIVFVGGEGGIGKTRLVYELARRARSQEAIFAVGPSYEEEILIPYSPWIEVIRSIVHQSPAEAFTKLPGRILAEVGRLVPELAMKAKELGIKGWLTGPEMGEMIVATDAERIRLFQSVTEFLNHSSRKKPVILFFDDVQWADAATLQLIHYYCRRIREEKIMLIAAYRDTELSEDSALSRLLLDLNRERVLKQVKLNRLTTDQVAEIISFQMGGGAVDPKFAKLIYSKSGGNPFFVEEILHSLAEENQISRSEEGWSLHEMEQVEIPSTVRALIKQRVSRLQEPALQTLFVGAVIGMDFGFELLNNVAKVEEEQLIGQLEDALHAGLIRENPVQKEVSYIFADEQIREYLYSELSLIRRRKLHLKVAETQERLYEHDKERHLEELAHHYIHGGNEAKAIEYSRMAGDRAMKLYAVGEAKRHYSSVLDLLGEDAGGERIEILMRLGEASFQIGVLEECVKYYKSALEIARRAREKRGIADIYSRLGIAYWFLGNDKQGALESYQEGLRALTGDNGTLEEARISQYIARLLVNTGDPKSGLTWCEKSIEIARSLNANEILAQGLQTLAIGLPPTRDNKSEIIRLLEESLSISLEHQLEDATCRAYVNLGSMYHHIHSDYVRSKEAYLKGVEYAKKIGYLNYESWLEAEFAHYAYLPLGEWEQAIETASHSLRIATDLGSELHTAKSLTPLASANLLRGNIARAEEYLGKAYPLAEKSQWTEIIYYCCLALGQLHLKKNDFPKAERYLSRGSEMALEMGFPPPFEIHFELVNLYTIEGDLEKARDFHGKLKSEAAKLDEKWGYAYERWAYGIIASEEKDWSEAKRAFKASAEIWRELKHPYNSAKTTLAYGDALSKSGNQSEGAELIAEARQTFSRLGAKLDVTQPNEM